MFAPLLARAKFLHSEPLDNDANAPDPSSTGATKPSRIITPAHVGICFSQSTDPVEGPNSSVFALELCTALRAALSTPGAPRCSFLETKVSSVLQLPAAAVAQARAGANVVVAIFPSSVNEKWELSALLTSASAGVVTPIIQGQFDHGSILQNRIVAVVQDLASQWAQDVRVLTSLTQASFHNNGPSSHEESKSARRGSDLNSSSTVVANTSQSGQERSDPNRTSTTAMSRSTNAEATSDNHEEAKTLSNDDGPPGSKDKYAQMLAASENTAWAQHVRSEQRDTTTQPSSGNAGEPAARRDDEDDNL